MIGKTIHHTFTSPQNIPKECGTGFIAKCSLGELIEFCVKAYPIACWAYAYPDACWIRILMVAQWANLDVV